MKARDEVEDRGLARAVRADEPDDLARIDAQVEPAHGLQAAEALDEALDLEQRHDAALPRPARFAPISPMRPFGRNEITSMRTSP